MPKIIYKIATTEEELKGYFAVRRAIFTEEQGLFATSDRDEHDDYAIHIVAVDQDTGAVIGAVRCYEAGGGVWYWGRLAVLKEYRRIAGLVGCRLVRMAEDVVRERGCRRFLAFIQLQNVRFFRHLGWREVGEPELHYGQLHQEMEANLLAVNTKMRPVAHV
ncbi:MAG: MSMEG_0567/Sll0786 family nitrogen starvation N-acetyltransferase [Chloroflexota bacterium]|jgi:putative N-acetyltransferase (TIGR04045 family)